jgi:hypothetical protein
LRVLARAALPFLAVLAAAAPVAAAPPAATATLGRLADAIAGEIVRVAGDRPVEVAAIEDGGVGSALAADLQSLVLARLEGRRAGDAAGPRVVVTSVAAQAATRLVWSARLTDESGALLDVASASMEWDPALLPLTRRSAAAGPEQVDVLERVTTPPIPGRIVALAFGGEDVLLVLFDDSLALFRRDGLALRLESRRELPGPLLPARFPGGLLLASERESACWALTSRSPRAVLFSIDGSRMVAAQQADALPWPRAVAGARFRPGTNLLDVSLPGMDGPALALEPEEGWLVAADGAIVPAGVASPVAAGAARERVGPAIARLWPGLLAAASADPPGEHDRILLLRDGGSGPAAVPVEGAVRALAARQKGRTAVLAAALEDARGGFRLALFALAERK